MFIPKLREKQSIVYSMECSFLSVNMRIPPPIPISSFIFSKYSQIHSRSLFLHLGYYSSSSCALDINSHAKKSHFFKKPTTFLPSEVQKCNIINNGNLEVRNLNKNLTVKWCSENLRNCTSNLSLGEGRETHGKIIKNGLEPDLHLWVSLINFYVKCGGLDCARKVIEEMPERDVVSWTALISGFVAKGYGFDGIFLFIQMQKEGIRPNEFTFTTVLKAVSICLELGFGKQVHTLVVKVGGFSDIYVASSLIDVYSKCGEIEYAKNVFSSIPEQNAVSWNVLLNGYAKSGDGEEIMKILRDMSKSSIKLSEYNLSTVLEGIARSGNLLAGEIVHCLAVKMGFELDKFVSSNLVNMYSKCGMATRALSVFKRITGPDIVAWTSIISCLDQQGHKQEALEQFSLMMKTGLRPNQYTFASLISASADFDLQICKSIHACVYKYAFEKENVVCNAMIAMYMKKESIRYGHLVFDKMNNRDVISWNALLSGLHDKETYDQGLDFFNQMLVEGYKPNLYTFISMLRYSSSLVNFMFGKQVHACIIKASFDDDGFVGTALLDMYAKCNRLNYAEIVFNRINCKDVFTWTVIISCYAQNDQWEKAIQSFTDMQKEGTKPNEYTLASCLRACAGISNVENGRLLHSLAIKFGHSSDIFVGSSVVDMYGKCGCIDDAEYAFESLDFRDTVTWNTMICGYAQHGLGYKSIESFKGMLDEGNLPDEITLLGILSACSHMGLIEEGKEYFECMDEMYGIVPSIEHYACMVDIIGRRGKFDEVDTFIKDMKFEPDALIWETLLGACRSHGNLELGKKAAEKLFDKRPEIDSNYILLSNIFASKGKWIDVSKVRSLMSSQGVKKEPGCSWVTVANKPHIFLSQDNSHPMIIEIYKRLDELIEKLSSVGYSPNIDYVLHDTSEGEKREILYHHSERLALSFSLISHSPCKTIRIFKNLRICGDCHEFMKLASEITNREIVVRDIKRFHHFRHGSCSCGDYW